MIFYALVISIVGICILGCWKIIESIQSPKKTITINLKIKYKAPIFKLGRHHLHMIIEHEIHNKGEVKNKIVEELDLKYKENEHKDMNKWLSKITTEAIDKHKIQIKQLYPNSVIHHNSIPQILESLEI
jgi:hypothetical protein